LAKPLPIGASPVFPAAQIPRLAWRFGSIVDEIGAIAAHEAPLSLDSNAAQR
jgi:hypothetical protein